MDLETNVIKTNPKAKTRRRRSAAVATAALLLAVLYLLQLLLIPKYTGAMLEGYLV